MEFFSKSELLNEGVSRRFDFGFYGIIPEMERRKLPIGIQDFEDLLKKGFVYIDKTAFIWNLAHSGKPYFLSRSRRFGKSLLLSTMKAYFQGRKDPFPAF